MPDEVLRKMGIRQKVQWSGSFHAVTEVWKCRKCRLADAFAIDNTLATPTIFAAAAVLEVLESIDDTCPKYPPA